MAVPNFTNRTLWTGDNLDILRGMNSESVDLIYLDPPFNSNQNYAAPVGSKAAGAAFKDMWTLSDLDVAWMGLIADEQPATAPRPEDGGPDPRQGDAIVPYYDGRAVDGDAAGVEGHGEHLLALRPDGEPLPEADDGQHLWHQQLHGRGHLGNGPRLTATPAPSATSQTSSYSTVTRSTSTMSVFLTTLPTSLDTIGMTMVTVEVPTHWII